MTAIAEIRPASAAAPAPATGAGSAQALEQRFLALLVAQMKNQDPLNPLDNAQITSQLAQLNTVAGIERLNAAIGALAAGLSALQPAQAAALIGRRVLAPGNELALAAGEARFGVELAQPVERLVVAIEDATGRTVHTRDLGPHPAGLALLAWDGRDDAGTVLADGRYRFRVEARSGAGTLEAVPLAIVPVTGVASGPAGMEVVLEGGRAVALAQVRRIF
jgi:flagellar basal-body rod modification protein FlgD